MDESDPFTALEDNDLDRMLSFLSDSSAAHNIALQVDAHDTSRMGPFVTLNEDVLRIILSLLPPPDACNMARTCRIAHSLATPYILSEVELRDWWPRRNAKRHAESFCHFILSTPERAHFLRKLDLRSLYICAESYEGEETTGLVRGSSMATALAAVIRQADNLEEVLIHCIEGDQALTAEPFLIHAIASRPCLRHLGLHTDGRDGGGLKLISQVCGPLRSLSLTILHGHPDSPDFSVLARIAGTLEILELNLPYIATDNLYDLGPDFSLPAVQQVILRGWTDVQEMRRILPDLRVMHLQGCRFRLDVNPVVPGGLFKANEIDELVTDVLVPKVLGGLVRRLHLQYDPFRRGTSVEMLAHMNPVVLSCALFMPGNYPLSNIDYIAQRLPRLRYLELSVGWGRMGPVSLSAQLAEGMLIFKTYALHGLALHLNCEEGITADIDALARDVANGCIPSLMYIGISLYRHNHTANWYRCARGSAVAGQVNVERLRDWEGEQVERQLRAMQSSARLSKRGFSWDRKNDSYC